LGKLVLPIQNRLSIGLKRLTIRLLLVEPLTLNDQDLERLLNRLDGETRLPSTTGRSFPLSHEEPPAALALPTGRKVGLFAAGIPRLKCRIAPSRERVVRTRYRTRLAAAVSRFAAVAALTTTVYALGTVQRGEAGHSVTHRPEQRQLLQDEGREDHATSLRLRALVNHARSPHHSVAHGYGALRGVSSHGPSACGWRGVRPLVDGPRLPWAGQSDA